MERKYRRNIALAYAFRFLYTFTPGDGIWVLYLLHKGLSLWQVGILEGIFHVAGLLSEVPSGALADLFGRKRVLLMSRVMGALGSAVTLCSRKMGMLGVGFVLQAWSYNLLSGSEEALVYDSFLAIGQRERYFKAAGRLDFIAEVSQAASMLLGGLLARRSYALCYLASIGVEALSFAICLPMTEACVQPRQERAGFREHFSICAGIIKGDGEVRRILLHYAVLGAFFTSVFFYSQEFYHSRGFDALGVSLVLLGIGACSSAGAVLSQPLARRLGRHACRAASVALALGLALMGSGALWLSLLGFGAAGFASAMLTPLGSAQMNERIPSAQRATVISVSSMCFSAVMIALFPLIGALAGWMDMGRVFLLLGLALLVYCLFAVCPGEGGTG